jgi:cytochrome oxidase assembly protein ShyY1
MHRRKQLFALIVAAAGIALTISLGNWQSRRGDAKEALQAEWDAAQRLQPTTLASQAALDSVTGALPRRVRLSGVFVPSATVYLDNRMRDGVAGFDLVTPLAIGDALPLVLVDRGWIARDMQDRARMPEAPVPAGEVVIEGLAVARMPRLLELGGAQERRIPGIWQNLDFETFEQVHGRRVARFVVQQTSAAPDDLRRDRPRPATGVEKHRGYALQWYSLAVLIAGLSAWFGYRELTGR